MFYGLIVCVACCCGPHPISGDGPSYLVSLVSVSVLSFSSLYLFFAMASRPLAFHVVLPGPVSRVDFLLELVKVLPTNGALAFQSIGNKKFELTTRTPQAADVARGLGAVVVKGETIKLVSLASPLTTVLVFGAPVSMGDAHIASALNAFGSVKRVSRELYDVPGIETIETGVRRVLMEIVTPVPNFFVVRGKRLTASYPGLRRVCLRCGVEGHFRKVCDATICVRCGKVGHETCHEPCRKCGGDHAASRCSLRTWADRVSAQPPAAPECVQSTVKATAPAVSDPWKEGEEVVDRPTSLSRTSMQVTLCQFLGI